VPAVFPEQHSQYTESGSGNGTIYKVWWDWEGIALRTCFAEVAFAAVLIGLSTVASAAPGKEIGVEPKIVDMPQMILVGVVQGAPDASQLDIGAMWQRFTERSEEVANTIEDIGYELHIQTPEEPSVHFCLTGVQVTELGSVPTDMFVKVLPSCTYAVFTHRVVEGYAKVYESINAWLESSEYAEAHPYDFQLYDSRFKSMDDPASLQDIYVPVRLE
jgi:AraC family transcriptional regulator